MVARHLMPDPATAERLVWTLVHFLWQGLALAALLAGALAVMHRRSAAASARYLAGCSCLLAMAAAPLLTFWSLDGVFDDPGPLVLPAPLRASAAGAAAPGGVPMVFAGPRSFL